MFVKYLNFNMAYVAESVHHVRTAELIIFIILTSLVIGMFKIKRLLINIQIT